MTTPHERTRALRQAGELLALLHGRPDVPEDLRKQAMRVLRHYPQEWAISLMAEDWQSFGRESFGLAPDGRPNSPADGHLALPHLS